jgi:ribonuclease BN (tRNA processing enzyme)
MRLTIVGSGDAFGSGGRSNTCFLIETQKAVLLLDCGASAPVALKGLDLDLDRIDGIVLSHLHGDHFGGLPFLLLDWQFLTRRTRRLLIAGPPGTRERLAQLLEVFFPRSSGSQWRFPWEVVEIALDSDSTFLGHTMRTTEVIHQSGAPSTAVRLSDGRRRLAYSGDTEWTESLLSIAAGTDLFICECYGYSGRITGHMSWDVLKPLLPALKARRIMVTHMNPSMLERVDEVRAAGVLVAEDGAVHEI